MADHPQPRANEGKADCYSDREAPQWISGRASAGPLRPLLEAMTRCRIRPDDLTALSAAAGLAFCPLYFWSKSLARAAIALHVLLDGLDGPLARHTNTASRRGSLADSASDQLVVVASTITLMLTHTVGILPGSIYMVAYTVVIMFAMIRNALSIPYSWLVRPRFVVYGWFLLEIYCFPGTIDYVLWFFNALLALKAITGFVKIRRSI